MNAQNKFIAFIKNKKYNVILLIFILHFILSLPSLNYYFSGDEIDTTGPARHFAIFGDMLTYEFSDGTPYYNVTHPPIRTIFYSIWSYFFGFSNILLRLVPVIFGFFVIALTYLIGKELYNKRVGIISAFFMTISRYFLYASQIVNNDNTLFIFIFEASLYFFILYKKRNENKFLLISSLFIIISFLTKFSFVVFIPSLFVISYLFGKEKIKKDIAVITISSITPFLLLAGFSFLLQDPTIFNGPVDAILRSSSQKTDIGSILYDKFFYVATFSWQVTPFLFIVLLIAMIKVQKDRQYYFLVFWALSILGLTFLSSGLDYQRYVTIALPPIFLLIGKYFENFDFKNKITYIMAGLIFILAAILNLSDMLRVYNIYIIMIFYVLPFIFLLNKKRKYLLIGGFIGLSLFSLLPNVTSYSIGANSVEALTKEINARNYDYKEMWLTRDMAFYVTPQNDKIIVNALPVIEDLTEQFIVAHKIKYMAYYDYIHEKEILDVTRFCKNTYIHKINGHSVGFVCETLIS